MSTVGVLSLLLKLFLNESSAYIDRMIEINFKNCLYLNNIVVGFQKITQNTSSF